MSGEWLRIGVGGVVPVYWEISKADVGDGSLSGWASVFNVIDQQDDVVAPGAFRRTLQDWRSTNRTIPLALDHEHTSDAVIGSLKSAAETPYGLRFNAGFSSVARAQEARTKAREGHLTGLSIFGPILRKSDELRDGREIRILHEVGLMEVSLTPYPANADAVVLSAKAGMGVHHTTVVDTSWDAAAMLARIPNDAGAAMLRLMFALIRPGADATLKGSYALPHHMAGADGRPGPANIAGVRNALARLPQTQGIDDATRISAHAHLQAHLDDFNKSMSLPEDWVADMRQALSIGVAPARKAAVDLLVAAQYSHHDPGTQNEPEPEPEPRGGADDAAKYALGVIGALPDAAGDPIDDLLAAADQEGLLADLDALESELKNDG